MRVSKEVCLYAYPSIRLHIVMNPVQYYDDIGHLITFHLLKCRDYLRLYCTVSPRSMDQFRMEEAQLLPRAVIHATKHVGH